MRLIKDLNEDDRPREKMLAKGEESLTNAELLAILIGSGTQKKSAVELMDDILRDCTNSLALLSRMTIDNLMAYNGIGEAKALTIKAAMELGRRRSGEEISKKLKSLNTARAVAEFMKDVAADESIEKSWVLLLNQNARLLRRVELSRGGRTETAVDVRVVLKYALLADATCIVLVHNHPSGNCQPSREDTRLTQRMLDAAHAVNIRLLDHVIVTDGDYYSFAENGQI